MYVVKDNELGVVKDHSHRRMSKERFKELTNLKYDSPISESASFTISARRFKVYDNCRRCVHQDELGTEVYDSRHVDEKLSKFLEVLDVRDQSRCGPFTKFKLKQQAVGKKCDPVQILKTLWAENSYQLSNNWCLTEPEYLHNFQQDLQKVLIQSDFPRNVINTNLDAQSWSRLVPKLPKRYQSVVMFFLYAQNIKGYQQVLLDWIYRRPAFNSLDFPILVQLCQCQSANRSTLIYLRNVTAQYKPESRTNENISKLIKMEIEQYITAIDLSSLPTPILDAFTSNVEWDNMDNYMKLQVM
ncbi:unnamed protein product [Kluyveromyces dobzhanskii CBS 2104]|uniref:WGS project CCBQ000000000 data, contig 00015 n=1 Tax=Kluyveromyces dobzhanskii CBS 2104 TaxID=1427455 RepID=A0A0A8LC50_9SACH|nr:unnamed protein product [Kluyveromyces dobzhanskii CBS 2104]